MVLWTVSNRRYAEKALACSLGRYFRRVYTWDDLPGRWKDVRRVGADLLIDDSDHHREAARAFGLESRYVVVPAYGCPADVADPGAWVRVVDAAVRLGGGQDVM